MSLRAEGRTVRLPLRWARQQQSEEPVASAPCRKEITICPWFPYEEWLRSAVSASLWYWMDRTQADDFILFSDEGVRSMPYRSGEFGEGRTFTRVGGTEGISLHISVCRSESGMVLVDGFGASPGFDPLATVSEEVDLFGRWCPDVTDAEVRVVLHS